MKDFQYITSSHPAYIENLYQDFLKDPESVDQEMRKFFEGFDFALSTQAVPVPARKTDNGTPALSLTNLEKEFAVYQLISAYRRKGHLIAKTNPIRERKDRKANLELINFGLTDDDLAVEFEAGKFVGLGRASLGNIVDHLQKCYTQHLGIEFSAVNSRRKIDWLVNAAENTMNQPVPLIQKREYFRN